MRTHMFSVAPLALALAGCAGPPCIGDCSTAVIAVGADADVLFPPAIRSDVGFEVAQQIFLKLADMGVEMNTAGDSGFVPMLAESWEFEDDLTLVFQLHPEARWHDGTPVTAADVTFSLDVYRDPAVASPMGPLLDRIASVTARDERTVEFKFTTAYGEQFYDATHHTWIIPRHILDSVPRDRLTTHAFGRQPVGAGPYRFVRWRSGETIEIAADSSFFLGTAGIARVIWRISPDYTTSLTQLIAGDADIVKIILGSENIERTRGATHIGLYEYPNMVYFYLGMNLRASGDASRPHALFGDRELRRAIALGTDRERIVRAVFGELGVVPNGPITPGVWIWDDDRSQLPFDSARARQMLDRMGWRDSDDDGVRDRDGTPLTFELSYPGSSRAREQISVILQEQLRRIGVAVELRSLEFNTFLERLETGRFDMGIGAWSVDPPPVAMRALWTSAGLGGDNHGRYANPVFDSLVDLAAGIRDKSAARTVWNQALDVINEDAPAVWLMVPTAVAGIHERFENVTIRPDLWAATLWQWRARGGVE